MESPTLVRVQSVPNEITVSEAAKLLGLSVQQVRNLIRAGDLPGWRKVAPNIENSPFFGPRAAVLAYLATRENKKG